MTTTKLNWLGKEVSQAISQKLASGLNKFDEQVARRAKANLYPGHGYLTGRLQTSITNRQVRMEGSLLVGAVGAYGIKYGMRIHDLYQYIEKALEDERGNAISIIGGG